MLKYIRPSGSASAVILRLNTFANIWPTSVAYCCDWTCVAVPELIALIRFWIVGLDFIFRLNSLRIFVIKEGTISFAKNLTSRVSLDPSQIVQRVAVEETWYRLVNFDCAIAYQGQG